MVPKTWPWYATSPSIWSAKSLTSDRSSAAESAPPGTRNTCWKSSARCGRNLVNLDSLPWASAPGRIDGGVGDRDQEQVNERQAKPDRNSGKADGGALRGGADDDVQKEEGRDDF